MKQTEQEKADELLEIFGDIKSAIRACDRKLNSDITQDRKAFYQRVKQILIDKQK